MVGGDLDRLKEDLATIRQAAGLELPFGREDINLCFAFGGTAVVALAWALIPHGMPAYWGFVPMLVLTVAWVVRMRVKYRQSTGRSPVRRREYTLSFILAVVLSALAFVYRIWGTKLGIPFIFVQGSASFFIGLAFVLVAILDRRRLSLLGFAVPLMCCGLAIPVLGVPVVVLFAVAMLLGGPACACIMAWQLRKNGAANAAD